MAVNLNVNNKQSQNETATQLFARLVNAEKKASHAPIDLSSTTVVTATQTAHAVVNLQHKRLVQLENDLMLNKTLNLDADIFTPQQVGNKEVVEVYGKANTGKSELIMHLLVRCLLPRQWKV